MPLVFGGWTSPSKGDVPTCTAKETTNRHLVCGRGSAVVTFDQTRYAMKHSRCFISGRGARLYFGGPTSGSPQNGLYLVIEPNRNGAVKVVDGGLNLSSSVGIAILGKAHATAHLRRGTFTVFAHLGDGVTDPQRKYTGSWRCG